MSGVESPSDPACDVGCEVVEAVIPRGGAEPTHNQLSGAVGGRASSALISIVKASLRAVFRGGSFVDGCGTVAQTALRRCLRLLRRVACCSLRLRKTRLVAHQELMLWRDVRRMRPGGEGACVTTLLEMPFGAQR